MQLNFNPMPATGDVRTTEAPPAAGNPTGDIQTDGLEGKTGKTESKKGFRETMVDLLRGAEPGEMNGDVPANSETQGGDEAPAPELGLLEVAVLPRQPKEFSGPGQAPGGSGVDPAGNKAPLETPSQTGRVSQPQMDRSQVHPTLKGEAEAPVAATGNGSATSEPFEFLKPVVKGEATTAVKGEATMLQKAPVQSPSMAENISKETVIDHKAAGEPKTAPETRVSTAPVEAVTFSETRSSVLKPSEVTKPQAKTTKSGLSQTPAASGSKASQLRGAAVHAPQAQDSSSQQAALRGDSTTSSTITQAPAAVKDAQPQGFATLVESIEKGGGEAKPMNPVVDNPIDAVGTSGTKQAPNTQSTISNVAKADPAPPPPLHKAEVIQQIVDSAKLRFQNGQGEMRIQLKPESLGHVRLNISTDQHQVMVKVVAQLPMVKELLESNLSQLRAELQGQGLEIDKFDVSVGGESDSQNKEPQTWTQRQNGRRGGGDFAQADHENPEGKESSQHQRQEQAEDQTDGVDYFA